MNPSTNLQILFLVMGLKCIRKEDQVFTNVQKIIERKKSKKDLPSFSMAAELAPPPKGKKPTYKSDHLMSIVKGSETCLMNMFRRDLKRISMPSPKKKTSKEL